MNEKTIKRLQALPRVSIKNGIIYYIIPQEEYEKLKDKQQEVKKAKDKIDYMKEYIKTVENARDDLERELEHKEQEFEELKEELKMNQNFVHDNSVESTALCKLLEKYKQALDEIEHQVTELFLGVENKDRTYCEKILDIINSVKDKNVPHKAKEGE